MSLAQKLYDEGRGVLRLAPAWVPRSFCRPAKRIKLHPDDYYVLGLARGGIDERWFASTTHAENGPGTPDDEGLSYIVSADGTERVLLRDAVNELKGEIIGQELWDKYGRWPVFSKYFDNEGPLPHHIHHNDEFAARVGQSGKPEMYFFPAQCNNHGGEFPFTFFGLKQGVTRDDVREALANFPKGDNKLLDLAVAYKLTLDTGWNVPPGVLHAPGSLCTYEPQFASDVFVMYQSVLYGEHTVPEELLWKDTPKEEVGNVEYLLDVMDWEANLDPYYAKNNFMKPVAVHDGDDYTDEWICYLCEKACAKRLTVKPGQTAFVRDAAAYGFIAVQGNGTINGQIISTPTLIRYGELTCDEYFVSASAASRGVTVVNTSTTEPLVLLKHFPENKERDAFAASLK